MEVDNLDERTAGVLLRRRGIETGLDIRSRVEVAYQLITTGKTALRPIMSITPIAELPVATDELPEV